MQLFQAFLHRFDKISTSYLVWGIVLTGFVVYFRTFFNGFVGDDIGYINHPYIQHFEVLKFFQSSSADLGGTSPITGQFFRPLMLVLISSIYQISGDHAFLYHLIQLLLHITNVVLLFFLFKHFFTRSISFLLACLYLVHPINVETVAYISDFQDILFVLFGLLAINLALYFPVTKKTLYGIPSLLFLSLLSKETGILFILCLIMIAYFFRPLYKRILVFLTVIPLLLYACIRVFIAGVWIGRVPHTLFGSMSMPERVMHIPSIIMSYLSTVFYPQNLSFGQTWTIQPSFDTVGFPLILILVLIGLLFMLLHKTRNKNPKLFSLTILFAVWLGLGLVLHVQLLPLEMTVAHRWFYFPFIGLLGIAGTLLTRLNKYLKVSLLLLILIILPLLSIRTFVRLGDWKNSLTLYKHDREVTESYLLENAYGYELMQRNDMLHAYPPLVRSIQLFETTNNTNTLGVYYFKAHKIPEAIKWMDRSTEMGDNFLSYSNLARIYLQEKSYDKAQEVLETATQKFPQSDALWYLLALTYYQRGDTVGALIASEKAYTLSPTQDNYYMYNQLRIGQPIKISD